MPRYIKNSKNKIVIKGAKVHNLKNIDLAIPRDKLVVITGLSGSGKSSLAFDTIYAEGQRRYVESLSAYARQFLGRMHKPEVDFITGIPPTIAIEQKINTSNPRSTVGTSTEIYDYLKLLFARIGRTFSPVSGKIVKKHSVSDVIDFLLSFSEGTKSLILSPLPHKQQPVNKELEQVLAKGFARVEVNGEMVRTEDAMRQDLKETDRVFIIIDRVQVQRDEDSVSRFSDSVETAFVEGSGYCTVKVLSGEDILTESFSNKFEADGMLFEEPCVHTFSFNNPLGACPKCEGYGKVIGIDEDLVVPNKSLSIYEGAIACWKGDKMSKWKEKLIFNADKFEFPIHKPYYELSVKQKSDLWNGNRYFKGIYCFFDHVVEKSYKIQYRVMLARYRGKTTCPECKGTRLKKEAGYVKIADKSLSEMVVMPVSELYQFFTRINFNSYEQKVASRIITEINSRLKYLINVGLSYLTLNRLSSTLSGGESQRINLATSLGSSLTGSLYVLDEPSIGLHPRDTGLLIKVLRQLQQIGNSVIVVEHDEEIINSADEIIDVGPYAGRLGGEIIFQGNRMELAKNEQSLTARYLHGKDSIKMPEARRKWNNFIEVTGARENNLKGINVKFPLNVLTVVTGVSGSGKSTLVKNILYLALKKQYNGCGEKTGQHDLLSGSIQKISNVEFIDQNPIGKSSRSNPVTYIKAYDEIRKLFADQQSAIMNNFKASHFSFNVDGGRCEECQGEGSIKVEMQFMADINLVCESCGGKRFKEEILDIKYNGKNIYNVLNFTVNEALEFFSRTGKGTEKKIADKLKPLADVGLGYIKLGQSSSTLSGGESQRVKLASFLSLGKNTYPLLFIFDEPTTGLHFHDIKKLLDSFEELIKKGHSIIVIEHHPDVIKCSDWIIDLGPEGGEDGGNVIFEGTPDDIVHCKNSYTGKFLKIKVVNQAS